MPTTPSLIEETARTACGILLLYKQQDQDDDNHHDGITRTQTRRSSSKSGATMTKTSIGNTNFLTTRAALEGTVPQYQQAENLILDAPIQFLSQIRSFIPPNLFAKKIHSTDFRILAAQCQAVRHSHPAEILPLWIENLCRNDITVNEMTKIVRETRIAKERLRRERREREENGSEEKRNGESSSSLKNKNEIVNDGDDNNNDNKYLAEITSGSALQVIQNAVSPLNACRAIFSSLYCFILQISSSVWSALERAHKEREMDRLSNRPVPTVDAATSQQQQKNASSSYMTTSGNRTISASGRGGRITTSTQLPPLVGVRQRPTSSTSSSTSQKAATSSINNKNLPSSTLSSSTPRPNTTSSSSVCDTEFLRTSQFHLDHSLQKLGGTSRRPIKPIRTGFRRNIHDNIAAIRSDELRSHVPLVNEKSRDSSSCWELACLDFSDAEYPHLAQLTQLQQQHGAELLENHYDQLVPQALRRESEKELIDLCVHVQQIIEEMFESSSNFLAPAFTQCLAILRGWFRNNNITNDFIAAGAASSHIIHINNSNKHKHPETANLGEPASTAMVALLGVEPRVPGPYIVTIDGARTVHIPHPLSSHSILVANALRHQSQMRMEKQKHLLKLQRAKTEKLLELQCASMRPRNDPRPAPHVPGRSRRAELGLETEGDSSETLEAVLSNRFHSMTTSVLRKRKF